MSKLRCNGPRLRLGAFAMLCASLGAALTGCGKDAPILNAVGAYSDVAILTDLERFNPTAFQLKKVLEVDPHYGLRPEKLFHVDIFDMSKRKKARVYKNIIVLGFRNGHDPASKEIRRKIGGQGMKVLPSRALFFSVKKDVYAGNQNVIFLAGEDRNYMQSAVLKDGPALRGQIEESNRKRVLAYLISQGRDPDGERQLSEQAGIRLTIPYGYRLNGVKKSSDGTMGMAEVVANKPTREVVIFWQDRDAADFDPKDEAALLELRRRWGRFLNETLQDDFGFRWELADFRGQEWPKLSGMYRTGDYGGPFRTIFYMDEGSHRLFGITWLTYFPGQDKHPWMREARAVAETFVPRP